MSALDRGIALGKALEALLEHRAPSAEPEPLYPLSELLSHLHEQGWKIVRDEQAMMRPQMVPEPYVLATFETLCGCKKQVFMSAPPRTDFKVPYIGAPVYLNGRTWSADPVRIRSFRLDRYIGHNEVLYREVAE